MTLIVETGAGIPTANSYVDIDQAQDYISSFSDNTITERSLIEATRQVDALYGHRYRGRLVGQPGVDQGLLFPRTAFTTSQGFTVAENTIPVQLKNFVCLLANQLVADPEQSTLNVESGIKSFSNSVDGVVSEQVEYFYPRDVKPSDEYAAIISPLLMNNSSSGFTVYQRVI